MRKMAALVRSSLSLTRNAVFSTSIRAIGTTNILNIKQIQERTEGGNIIVEAVRVPSPRAELLVRADKIKSLVEANESILAAYEKPISEEKTPCYMCALGLDVKHTDVLILSQFVRSDGCMLPRRITGLCRRQQKKIGKMVSMAQKAGLMINLTPSKCNKDPKKRKYWKKFNTYFDEKTIFMKRIPKQEDRFAR